MDIFTFINKILQFVRLYSFLQIAIFVLFLICFNSCIEIPTFLHYLKIILGIY